MKIKTAHDHGVCMCVHIPGKTSRILSAASSRNCSREGEPSLHSCFPRAHWELQVAVKGTEPNSGRGIRSVFPPGTRGIQPGMPAWTAAPSWPGDRPPQPAPVLMAARWWRCTASILASRWEGGQAPAERKGFSISPSYQCHRWCWAHSCRGARTQGFSLILMLGRTAALVGKEEKPGDRAGTPLGAF